ncbi:MAG: 4Fe-4S dicluster domain-containing protein [Caldimicrobium sp.]|nr:4Fe-4S dicluster domain-containing protein [Caldimicrobium sp.]MCX7874004.1 4Fe-4S dicluster domain-containing protein [Caldimicrobium sp.]MDW8094152.1 4Fe-4S dicluster domain-containing protein [Caldimicrobium sp.]
MNFNRRQFFKVALGLSALALTPKELKASPGKYATLIDITKCDRCEGEFMPLCVKACREVNKHRFPDPKKPIPPYWPRKTYEDWSDKREIIDTLSPYNWLFIQKVEIEGHTLFIPRRCMHCDSPPCVKGCPFGALSKQPEGNTVIDHNICFGGAKCRDVCPWHIPQRQAGVGIYLKLMPKLAGGGVMYKCDLCDARIKRGEEPACVVACRERLKDRAVYTFGKREEIFALAKNRASEEGLYIYGDRQNGGTSTLYLSSIPFEKIEAKLKETRARFGMPVKVVNRYMEEINPWGKAVLVAGALGIGAGLVGAFYSKKEEKEEKHGENQEIF